MKFWEKPVSEMSDREWESLCDGCALCCLFRGSDGQRTNISCKLLNTETARCRDYRNRQQKVSYCGKVTPDNIEDLGLPETCAYRRVTEGRELPDWHYLLSGDRDLVHKSIRTAKGAVSEVLIPVGSITFASK